MVIIMFPSALSDTLSGYHKKSAAAEIQRLEYAIGIICFADDGGGEAQN